jgi:hypothetical protein
MKRFENAILVTKNVKINHQQIWVVNNIIIVDISQIIQLHTSQSNTV